MKENGDLNIDSVSWQRIFELLGLYDHKDQFSIRKPSRVTSNWELRMRCIFHRGSSSSLLLYKPEKTGPGRWEQMKCYGCGKAYTKPSFVQEVLCCTEDQALGFLKDGFLRSSEMHEQLLINFPVLVQDSLIVDLQERLGEYEGLYEYNTLSRKCIYPTGMDHVPEKYIAYQGKNKV